MPTVLKVGIAVLSILVLGLTGYGWSTLSGLQQDLTTSDVIERKNEQGKDGAIDILLVGSDSRLDAQGNPLPKEVLRELRAGFEESQLTDTLILIRIPNDGRSATGVSFPRDSYVDIPGGHGKHKINSAFSRAKAEVRERLQEKDTSDKNQLEQQAGVEGRKTLIKTIEQLTGAGIDHYAEVNLLGFYEITKAIGGVTVCLNDATKDKLSGANFRKGEQKISGGDALAFVRQRHGLLLGDLDRVRRQQVFMSGLARQMLSAGVLADPSKLRNLMDALKKSIVLDQGWDVISFAQQMQGIAGGKIDFQTIPITTMSLSTPDGDAVGVDPKQVKQFVSGLLGSGAATTTPTTGSPTTGSSTTPDNANVTVDVRNASGLTGLASRVLEALTEKGFLAGDTANATTRPKSVVRYAKGDQSFGAQVADALGGMATEVDANLPAGRVRVFLGKDYSGPGARGFAAGQFVQLDGVRQVPPAPMQPPAADQTITASGVACVN